MLDDLIEGDDWQKWPVLHTPIFANTFPLAYKYAETLVERTKATDWNGPNAEVLIKAKIRIDEWDLKPPMFDHRASHNIFFANRKQKERFSKTLDFHERKIFKFAFKSFFVRSVLRSETPRVVPFETWLENLEIKIKKFDDSKKKLASAATKTSKLETIKKLILEKKSTRESESDEFFELVLTTDVRTEAEDFRVVLVKAFIESNIDVRLRIVKYGDQPLEDSVLEDIDESREAARERIFFVGLPLLSAFEKTCGFLAVCTPPALETFDTWLCIHASEPDRSWAPVSAILAFFEWLKYPIHDGVEVTSSEIPVRVSSECIDAFFKVYREPLRFLGVSKKQDVVNLFNGGIGEHCNLVWS